VRILDALQQAAHRLWEILGSVPLWLKIVGIVVLPVILVGGIALFGLRQDVLGQLRQAGLPAELRFMLPVLTRDTLFIILITAILGLLLAVGLSLVLTRPLNQLIEVIRRVEKGDLSARVNVWAQDEIGAVQAAFNQMVGELAISQANQLKLNQELQMLNNLLAEIAVGETAKNVIQEALQQAVRTLNADVGSYYALDRQRQEFVLQASQGYMPEETAWLGERRSIQDTPMRRALESGQVETLENLQQTAELPPQVATVLDEMGIQAMAFAPVRAQGQVSGMLSLGKRRSSPFTAADRSLLEGVGSVIGIGLENARLLDSLRAKEAEMRHALQRAVELQEEERLRISRELHDEVGQALTSILIRLKTIQQEAQDEAIIDRLNGLRYLTGQSIEELRRLAMDLRPAALDNLGIVPALRWYIEQTAANTGCAILYAGPEQVERLPGEVELALYRIAQEGIANALRHGHARHIQLTLQLRPAAVWMEIVDDGEGFEPEQAGAGLGLVGIRERVGLLDGVYGLQSDPERGTRLWVEIPLAVEARS
jgi:signal transduction histidine kinase